jgi:hypothetical protein
MPEWIVFQELPEEQVLEQPMSVAAMVVMADDHEGAIQAVTKVMAFMPGAVIGAIQVDDRKSFEVVGTPELEEKPKKPKE